MNRKAIAEQTVQILDARGYPGVDLTELIDTAVAGTRLHLSDEALSPAGQVNPSPLIEVTFESTLAAARRAGPGSASLVFASARNPGGGFLGGAEAQEESIARSSALYACQLTQPAFYEAHRASRDLRYSHRAIYSPAVPVFRNDKGTLLESPYTTAMLTCAAPNLGAIRNPDVRVTVPEVLRARASRVLEVAAFHGHRTLVLGAWGCGVFRNDAAVVAEAFAHALKTVPHFDFVVFAVRDRLPNTPVYRTFAAAFG
ncbi:MAG TPA: TIGR02452 family protein [Candidatus Limnocylindrales bacterium]|nr:TIGR02452 family protein [Candidatus Limnocylindrales bacterium]